LGEFEQIVLLSILRLGETAYGVRVRAEIAKHTGRSVAPGALYTTLERLEEKGLVTSRLGDPTPERGGRAKRYYKVSGPGLKAVRRAQNAYQSLLKDLDILGGPSVPFVGGPSVPFVPVLLVADPVYVP
jgi:DNA-binding PadR family transcriptional regulator